MKKNSIREKEKKSTKAKKLKIDIFGSDSKPNPIVLGLAARQTQ
jgi:hypothetical protein